MNIRSIATASAVTLVALVAITGCGSDPATEAAPRTTVTVTATPAESAAPTETDTTEQPLSDIQAAVQVFVTALDDLGIEHTDPVRGECGLSGAQACFDMTVNGYDSGINVFADEASLAAWQEASDSLGGISVTAGTAALSLNSSDGIANSAEIAPQIAEAVGGVAHGV